MNAVTETYEKNSVFLEFIWFDLFSYAKYFWLICKITLTLHGMKYWNITEFYFFPFIV